MRKIVTLLLASAALPLALGPAGAFSGDPDASRRTQEILAQMNRKEHKVKEAFGLRVEKYREIRSEPALKKHVRDYAGVYEVPDRGYSLTLRIGDDGRVQGDGSERPGQAGQPVRRFTLRSARIEGALLRATKVYDDGATETLEGVFITRTERNSPTDAGRSRFGLGVLGAPVTIAGATRRDKLFYQFQTSRYSTGAGSGAGNPDRHGNER
jgi:hypothetical protein